MRDILKQLDTRMQSLEAWKRSDFAREELSTLDAKVGRYLLMAKVGIWAIAALGAGFVGYISWRFLAATPQLIGLGAAAFLAAYSIFRIWRLAANPPKASAIVLAEIEKRAAPVKATLWIARFVLPKLKTRR